MNDQVNEETLAPETNSGDYPEVFSIEDIKKDEQGFIDSVATAGEGIAEDRQFRNFDNLEDIPEGFEVMIEPKSDGSFEGKPALFIYAIPTVEAIMSHGQKGQDFVRDSVISTITRKASSYCWAVNRPSGAFNAPTNMDDWLDSAKPKTSSTGVRFSRKGWNAISEQIVNTINELYKKHKHPKRINKRDLLSCMSSQANAELLHDTIKAWDKIFVMAEKLITEHCEANSELDTTKELKILEHWKATRNEQAAPEELEITDLDFA